MVLVVVIAAPILVAVKGPIPHFTLEGLALLHYFLHFLLPRLSRSNFRLSSIR